MENMENLVNDITCHISRARDDFLSNGLAIIPDFVKPEIVQAIVKWADKNQNLSFEQTVHGNAYLNDGDKSLGEDHVLNRNESTTLGVIAYDQIEDDSPLKKIFLSKELRDMVAKIVGKEAVYSYDCALGAINIAVMKDGHHLRWHFDQSDFVVSIPLRAPESGGTYQYVRNLKSHTDPCYSEVEKVLDGDHKDVQDLVADPGSLVLFEGINTLHRVTEIKGEVSRLVALLGFVDKPGIGSSEYLRKIRYGRTN